MVYNKVTGQFAMTRGGRKVFLLASGGGGEAFFLGQSGGGGTFFFARRTSFL